jgi:hypothetical protein
MPLGCSLSDVVAITSVTTLKVEDSIGSPLDGLATTPLGSLRDAVAAAEKHVTCAGGLSVQLEEAFAFATSKVHSGRAKGLTVEQVAAINLYVR